MILIVVTLVAAHAAVLIGLSTGSSPCPDWQGDDALIEG